MATTTVITARIHNDLAARLDKLAAVYDRSRGWVMAKALERYCDEELELVASLEEAEADSAAGRVFSQEQVEAMFEVQRGRRDAA